MSDREIIYVNSDADQPANIFDGKVRTLIYPSGMEMTVGLSRDLDHIFPRESPEEFDARLEQEAEGYREAIEADPKLKALCEKTGPGDWLD